MGAKSSSWFLYPRTKGRVEEAAKEIKDLPILAIHRAGMLFDRENDERMGEKILGAFRKVLPGIQSKDMGKAMLEHAIYSINGQKEGEKF